MQNRYVGDVGDFAKYALLRRLAGETEERKIRLGVVWCLYPDEVHNSDGRHVSYLRSPDFAGLDVDLLRVLRRIVKSGNRNVSAVVGGRILPKETIFCCAPACSPQGEWSKREDRLVHRLRWIDACIRMTVRSELIFFDPDNGIEVASVPKHHQKAGKYIYWDELKLFWDRGQALLIYHHLNRTKPAVAQIAQMSLRLNSVLVNSSVKPIVFRRGSARVFWLVFRRSELGRELERRANQLLGGDWGTHFRMFG